MFPPLVLDFYQARHLPNLSWTGINHRATQKIWRSEWHDSKKSVWNVSPSQKGDIALQLCDQTETNCRLCHAKDKDEEGRRRSVVLWLSSGGRVHPWRYKWQRYYCGRATAFAVIRRCDRRATRDFFFRPTVGWLPREKKRGGGVTFLLGQFTGNLRVFVDDAILLTFDLIRPSCAPLALSAVTEIIPFCFWEFSE